MSVDVFRAVLGWCTIINDGVLVWWFVAFRLAHDWIYRLHSQWFPMPVEQFTALEYAGMAIYKLEVLLSNLVPYVALLIVGRRVRECSPSFTEEKKPEGAATRGRLILFGRLPGAAVAPGTRQSTPER